MKMVVIRPGLLDTIQDLGRPGFRQMGIPEGGAADREAIVLANRLVGNEDGAACIEFALRGPLLRFPNGGVVSLTGARFEIGCAGGAVSWNQTLVLGAGEELEIGRAIDGCRGYLGVAGGISLGPVLDSCATFLPGAFGGLNGRQLKRGDELLSGESQAVRIGRASVTRDSGPLRVVAGPQLGAFTEGALLGLFSGSFIVDVRSDRTGIRLSGPGLETSVQADLPSQGVLPGALQVPPEGQPIIVGWDGPVTGGYPVIAGVIAADLARVAQLRPGDRVNFMALDPEQARHIWADRQMELDRGIAWLA
ncbi:MAG: biotin-dependent carboxyltransferase family protein [Thiobacillaceae bacterium]